MTAITSAATPRWLRPALLDRIEQAAIALLWVWFAWRVFHSENPFGPLALLSETAVLLFVLIRRPTREISLNLGDWLLAITATAAPLLIVPGQSGPAALVPLGIALVFLGNCGQAWAKLVLRRSFGVAPANRGIKISGPYKLVRHPMYAGYLLVHVGICLLMPSLLNLAIYAIGWWAQILRLSAEERLLGEDPEYRAYSDHVHWRLVPKVF